LRLSHERWGRLNAQEPNLVLKMLTHVDTAVIVPQPQAGGDAARKTAEVLVHSLT
jgi:hypothetical protein